VSASLHKFPSLRALLACALLAPLPISAQPISVTREAPVVTRIEFERERPPPSMPKLTPPESGVCDTTFELAAGIGYSLEVTGAGSIKMWVEKIDIVTRQRIDIYTLAGAPAKLRAHEEGHRAISEHYYANAAVVARVAATPLIGKMFTGSGATRGAAEKDAQSKVLAVIEQAYMTRMRGPSVAANARFDELTQHGLNGFDEAEAIALAIGSGLAAAAGAR
jgi:hypothetical protein